MRCPCCGSPATVRGNRWECGYCGDSGFLNYEPEPEITFTMTVEYEVNYYLQEIWDLMTSCLEDLAESNVPELTESLKKVVLYEITLALFENPRVLPGEKEKQLREFLTGLGLNTEAVFRAFRTRRILCEDTGKLTEDFCGSFFAQLIRSGISEYQIEFSIDLFVELHRLFLIFRTDRYDSHFLDLMCTHSFPEADRKNKIFQKFYGL